MRKIRIIITVVVFLFVFTIGSTGLTNAIAPGSVAVRAPLFHDCYNDGGNASSGRVLILIQGLGTDSTPQNRGSAWAKFKPLVEEFYSRIVYFSYQDNSRDYQASDTRYSIQAHHVPLLYSLIASCRLLGFQSFDIIGHSQGGVVASEYIKLYGINHSQAGLVKHVVTLDSPLNGAFILNVLNFTPAELIAQIFVPDELNILYQLWKYDDFHGPSAIEMAGMYRAREVVRSSNKVMANTLWKRGIVFRSYTNCQDFVIVEADAVIPDAGYCFGLGRDVLAGHFKIMDLQANPEVANKVRADLQGIPSFVALNVTASSQTQIDLSWQSGTSNLSDFHIERSPNGSTNWTEIPSVGANVTSYSNTGLPCGTTYFYRVRAHRHSDGFFFGYSNIINATTSACSSACFTLTINANPSGSGNAGVVSPAPNCGIQYRAGTPVTVTATPNSGYSFTLWTGNASGSTIPTIITMDGNKTITANFARNSDKTPPTVSWVSPSNGQTITSSTVRLQANPSYDPSGINRVSFSALWGGNWHGIATLYSAPYVYDWNMCGSGVPDGDVELGLEV